MKPNRHESEGKRRRAEECLYRAVASLETGDECGDFLRDLCTPAELQALVDRWQVAMLLKDDMPYRKIHELTGVSVTTIGRVARFLNDGFGGYRMALSRTQDDAVTT